jgi:CBS-domain-containing membrane protein
VLSATDFVRHLEKEEASEAPSCSLTATIFHGWQMVDLEVLPTDQVRNYMTPEPVTIVPTTSIVEMAQLMLDAHIHHLIVVDEDQHPVGIVTTTDLLAAIAHTSQWSLEQVETEWPMA